MRACRSRAEVQSFGFVTSQESGKGWLACWPRGLLADSFALVPLRGLVPGVLRPMELCTGAWCPIHQIILPKLYHSAQHDAAIHVYRDVCLITATNVPHAIMCICTECPRIVVTSDADPIIKLVRHTHASMWVSSVAGVNWHAIDVIQEYVTVTRRNRRDARPRAQSAAR